MNISQLSSRRNLFIKKFIKKFSMFTPESYMLEESFWGRHCGFDGHTWFCGPWRFAILPFTEEWRILHKSDEVARIHLQDYRDEEELFLRIQQVIIEYQESHPAR